MEAKQLSIIGSTGSVGTQTLEVAEHLGYGVCALAANSNIELLERQIRKFRPAIAAVAQEEKAQELRARIRDLDTKVVAGREGVCQAAASPSAELTVAAAVGIAGLFPVLEAVRSGKTVALANKETLVAAGSVVMPLAKENGASILTVDSEHSAILQSLRGNRREAVSRLFLTCSGGPFYGKTREELQAVTVQDALRHPNWSMGGKITIDCATLMNKGLEVMEAMWLFDMPAEQIEILLHRESVVHSLVEYRDRSVIAQLGTPDMRTAIQYALTYPERQEGLAAPLDLTALSGLTFRHPDEETFECLAVCRKAAKRGGTMPAAVNGANEEAVAAFLEGRLGFLEIGQLVSQTYRAHQVVEQPSLEEILEADRWARSYVKECLKA